MSFLYRIAVIVLCVLGTYPVFAQPVNDDCFNPIILSNLDNWCSAVGQFTNVNATPSPQPGPTCFPNFEKHDVWFAFQAQANTVNINIIGNNNNNPGGTLENPQVALYSGSCVTGLTQLECISDQSNNTVETFGGPLTVGQTYFLRIDSRFGIDGTFQLCINNFNFVPEPYL